MAVLVSLALWYYRPRSDSTDTRVYWGSWGLRLLAVGLHCVNPYLAADVTDVSRFLASCYGLWNVTWLLPEAALELWTLPLFENPPAMYWEPFANGYWPHMRHHVNMLPIARDFAFVRVFAFPYALAGGNMYACTVLLAGAGHWASRYYGRFLVRGSQTWPYASLAIIFLPMTLFWTSGLYKETFLWVLGALVLACARITLACGQKRRYLPALCWGIGALILVVLTAAIRPFWAIAIGACATAVWAGFWALRLRGSARLAVLGGLVLGSLWLLVASPFRLAVVLAEIDYLRQEMVLKSGNSAFSLFSQEVGPTRVGDLITLLPRAALLGLYRPLPGEVPGWVGLAFGLERLLLIGSTVVLVWLGRPWRGFVARIRARPWVVACAGFGLIYAALLALSTPNYGTLSRYMAVVWPAWAAAVVGLCAPLPHAKNG